MNCVKIENLLVEYAENELPSGKRRRVERHLADCENCRRELSKLRELRENLLSLETPDRGSEFWESFNLKLTEKLKKERIDPYRPPLFPALKIAAAAAALIIVGLVIFQTLPKPEPSYKSTAGAGGAETSEILASQEETSFLTDDEFLLAMADLSGEEIDEAAAEAVLLMEADMPPIPDNLVMNDVYEHSIYDLLDDLSPEEGEEFYGLLDSI